MKKNDSLALVKHQGFTLVELMIVVAIVSVLLAVALPSYNQMVKNSCLTTRTNDLVTAFQFARNNAIKSNKQTTVSANYIGNPSINAANKWANGLEIKETELVATEDTNGNGVLDPGEDLNGNNTLDTNVSTPTVVRVFDPVGCIKTTINEIAGKVEVRYLPDGSSLDAVTVDLCDDRSGETGRRVTISAVGRVNSSIKPCI